jgi:enolase
LWRAPKSDWESAVAKIETVSAREILNSRGYPTVEAAVVLDDGAVGVSSIPEGASTGSYEAVVLLDNDARRYAGRGMLQAVANINVLIADKLKGMEAADQKAVDEAMIQLDGTENKSWLGANAVLPVSQAVSKAAARSQKKPLYAYLAGLFSQLTGFKTDNSFQIPTPMVLMIEGGKAGAGNLDFQEFMISPAHARNFPHALRMATEIYYALRDFLKENQQTYSVGFEGGYTPNLYTNMEAFSLISQGVERAGYHLGQEVFFCLDVAASNFEFEGRYSIKDQPTPLSPTQMISYYEQLILKYHLLSIEDPLDENDWKHWSELTGKLGNAVSVVGDDLLAANTNRLRRAIAEQTCNAILIKPNQIGTVSETLETAALARKSAFQVIIGHRGGETNDSFTADLAVALGAQYVKFGAPARGERVAKYNRLLKIFTETSQKK